MVLAEQHARGVRTDRLTPGHFIGIKILLHWMDSTKPSEPMKTIPHIYTLLCVENYDLEKFVDTIESIQDKKNWMVAGREGFGSLDRDREYIRMFFDFVLAEKAIAGKLRGRFYSLEQQIFS